jgi:phosphoserine phosphatase RsbU/P
MFSNLLGNAVTHGPPVEPIEVRTTTQNGIFELSVSNPGDPIPPAAMAQLFQPFYRGTVSHSLQGLGLGLYIASEIARAHDGMLDVNSTADETRFTFRMPIPQGIIS